MVKEAILQVNSSYTLVHMIDSLNLNAAQKICLPFIIRITASMEYILSGGSEHRR